MSKAKIIATSRKSKSKLKKQVIEDAQPARVQKGASFERITTGIEGVDQILRGGFLKGGTYLILGVPGAGKTIFANQLCFHQIGLGQRAVYVTLLAESHTRMFGNLNALKFFEDDKISEQIQYMSGYSVLEKEGLDGLLRLLRDLVEKHRASVLFIDGVSSADALSSSAEEFKKFVHHLNSVIGINGCTTFLLSSVANDENHPEYTMVDGIVNLSFCTSGLRTARQIEVRKFRGSPHLYGRHFLEISEEGIDVFPRIDAMLSHEKRPVSARGRLKFGMKELDAMLDGGLVRGSLTTLLGAAGTGKTQLGTQFLRAGAELGEQSSILSFYENPDRLEDKLASTGRSMKKFVADDTLSVLRPESSSRLIDKTLGRLLKDVRERGTKRLFIDGVHGMRQNMFEPERLNEVVGALRRELTALGITTLLTEETDSFQSSSGGALSDDSAITDNTFEFRHAEIDGVRCQTFTILKTRESTHDNSIRLVEFGEHGMQIESHVEYEKSYLPVVRRKMK